LPAFFTLSFQEVGSACGGGNDGKGFHSPLPEIRLALVFQKISGDSL
jgi:hypothetical protein